MPVSHNNQFAGAQYGFTLLELLVVLAMLGLLGSIAVPALGKLLDSLHYRSDRSNVLAQISALSYRNYLLAQDYTLTKDNVSQELKDGHPAIELPSGWSIQVATPIRYQFNGYCIGGVVLLNAPEHPQETIRLQGPVCEVSDE
jgi:prepilin-type N-terminal cleavage/methylation domain-containing protein